MDTVYGKAAAKAKCSPSSSAENSLVNVSQAIPASSSGIVSIPQPSEALLGNSPPPFLSKTYDMVDDPNTDDIVSWSSANNSFIVWNPPELGDSILPNYFKHNNFSSFVRQLNTYGFRKVDPDRWEFAAEGFLRRQKHLLNTMHRRRRPVSQNQMQEEKFEDLEEEVEQLKRDKNLLMHELIEMRQQQQTEHQTLKTLGHRLAATEQRQQQMMAFLAKTMQNPFIFAKLFHQNDANKRIDSLRRRRELPRQEQLTQRVAASECCIPEHQGTLMDPAQDSFTDFNNPQSASVDMTCNLLKEPFHGIEPEIRGESATSTSDSHPNINLSASFASAETKQVSRDGEDFTSAQSSGGESHMVVAPDVASTSTQQYLEGAEVLEMESASDERQMSTVALPPILDDTLEGDWTEIFESIQQI